MGLPDDLALRLARATVEGSGELLHLSPEVPAEILRKNVTSPGGTTQAALDVLMAADGLAALDGTGDDGGGATRGRTLGMTLAVTLV